MSRRILWGLVTLFLVVTIAFFAVNLLLPYDYAVVLGQRPRPIEQLRQQLGLNRPLWVRWLEYMWGFVRGDLGESYDGYRVTTHISAVLPATVALFAVGGVVAYLFGEWLGRLVAWSRSRVLGATSSTLSVLFFSAFPPFLVFVLLYFGRDRVFQVRSWFGLGPVGGPMPLGPVVTVLAVGLPVALIAGVGLRSWARRQQRRVLGLLAIPLGVAGLVIGLLASGLWAEAINRLLWPGAVVSAVALILIAFGETMLVMRAGVDAEMTEDYVFTARAKAVPGRLIRDRHLAPNAALPAISRLFTSIPYLLGGLVIIEAASGMPGLGSVFLGSIETGDVPVIIGIIAVIGIIGLALRIGLDAVQAVIDPRIRTDGGRP
ncbi:MAG: ABC transporter permease [Acidimicrobiia bacterium]|nr:ABC transporter permease [Acidimicrobiia bacterium]